ncbi:TPA: hypothetical protein QDC20_000330 [Burkholderia aenigmatica]|uniref:hypothetical protein n=1 Tax=Burkholderia sp. AU45251 TaxID=3059204 RepID=UPI0026504A28|nr:hypothetical protein [Burkholderia sp. AU45251]HDR9483231.1 hypothetical protein [Burkholderia aenigmatica]MDN7516096.1 hypothetical protein [Burkholderia sp. AU45251]HDR9514179.1 hypothetical protein [Burkholderia aenigmatica]HDR9591569.1 hypothetical protein [Burkholderia aenigmatica]HDR9598661.1 hypothetical protein [Burkholderia aenigmatica]
MMTLRLPDEVEAELEIYCKRNGTTKNAAVTEATKRLLATPDIAKLELAEPLNEPEGAEARYERRRARLERQYEIEVVIAGWIAEKVVWTKKHDPSGSVRPGVHGRNTVVGFCDTMWREDGTIEEGVFVIAEHHAGRPSGIQAYHRYIMPYETWCEYMRIVPRA